MLQSQPARVFLAGAAGTVALVIWGMIFWAVLAVALGMFHTLPNESEITELLQAGEAETGTYFVPWPRDTPEAFDAFVARHKAGSFYKVSYIKEGVDPNSAAKILLGTLQYAVVAALAVGLLALASPQGFRRRAGTVFLAGCLGTLFITIADPVWFHLPWDYTAGAVIFELVAWALLGVSVAAVYREPAEQQAP